MNFEGNLHGDFGFERQSYERSEDEYHNRNLNNYTGHQEEFYDAPYETDSSYFDDGNHRNSYRNFNQGNDSLNERASRYDMEQNYSENLIRSTNASSEYDHRHHKPNDFQCKQRNETRENRHSAQYPKYSESMLDRDYINHTGQRNNYTSDQSRVSEHPSHISRNSRSLNEEIYESVEDEPDYEETLVQKISPRNYLMDNSNERKKGFRLGIENNAFESHEVQSDYELDSPDGSDNLVQMRHPDKGENSSVILDDGRKTYVFRKKAIPINDRRSRTASHRRSTVKRKSAIPEGYVPSHRENVVTLKEKKQMLEEQDTIHGVVNIFREKILKEPELIEKGFAGWRHRQTQRWNSFTQQVKNIAKIFEPWAGSFKTVEGRFGTAIMNYFRFIRWLMFMNLYTMIIMMCVTLVPHFILKDSPFNNTISNKTIQCTEEYGQHIDNITDNENIGNQIFDFIQGTGWMEQTVLFYGAYRNKTMLENETTYNMSLAYLLATGGSFLISFFLIVRNTGKGIKRGVMNKDSTVNQYTNKVFCGGWDFCINVDKAAKRRHRNFFQELQGDLETQRLIWRKQSLTLKDKIKLYIIRMAVNIFVVAALSGSLYLIFFTNEKMLELQDSNFSELHVIVQALIQYMPSITITLLNVIVPVIFNKLVIFEDYTPVFEIRINLLRIILLRLASLGILIGSMYRIIASPADDYRADCGNQRWEVTDQNRQVKSSIKCWETYVGQQIYKLMILDFLVGLIITFVVEFPRRIIYKKFHNTNKLVNMVGQQEFNLPKVVLDIVYSQTLCWMGLFFCPLTPILGFLKCFIFFYVRKLSLMKNCVQPVRPYRTSRTNSLFAAVLFLSFLLATIPLAYLIGSISPSQSCGPFRQYMGGYVFFDVIPNEIQTWPSAAVKVFTVLGSTAFLIPAILVVCSIMYGYWASKEGSKRQAELIQEELTEEGRDKQFLVAQVNEILQHLDATNS
ncbi:transmembrane channel-like protein 7 [Mytilus californianus]|uniref:transmembrane channel-like protein 7 n=1 Tax=Mytilus californianus TaxID=6549 RepID=UPI0022482A3C|nr:transmembrane channel-like protein 7 [Mytilus californianus]